MKIPKIIHQIWVGPKKPPIKLMNTWKNKHESEGFEYIIWTDEEMKKRGFVSVLQNRIDEMRELAGVADILRWEILYKYGGIYVDADSFCLESITYLVEKYKAFVGYENEQVRGAGWVGNNPEYDDVLARTHPLISNGTMAFPPKHELPRLAIEYIKKTTVDFNKCFKRAWRTTGPGLLTRLYFSKKWDDITILPSYCFLPIHCSGVEYKGHSKIYAHQEWGSTKDTYENINNLTLPEQFNIPSTNVSILIANYNTKAIYIKECLDSIKHQEGNIFIEIVWIDDGSDNINKNIAKKQLDNFINTTRFTSLVYKENDKNYGLGRALHDGVNLCTNEIIFRMDTDDIMIHTRISKQLDFMDNNPDAAICGAQIAMFRNNIKNIVDTTNHPNHTLESYKNKPVHWIMNHPTFCFRKSKIIEAGNYNKKTRNMIDDFELELKLLQKYKIIYNIPEILLLYRLHPGQLTHKGGIDGPKKWKDIRNKLIQDIIYTQ